MTARQRLACGLALMLVLVSLPAMAEGGYQIELIIFAQSMPSSEIFEQSAGQIDWPPALTELSAYDQAPNRMLDAAYAALSTEPDYHPLLHIAWIQPGGEGAESTPVHIQDAGGKLNGYFMLRHDQGLQMTVDVEMAAKQDEKIYRLHESRPIKLNQVYYLDHPKVGLVATISPR